MSPPLNTGELNNLCGNELDSGSIFQHGQFSWMDFQEKLWVDWSDIKEQMF